MPIRVNSLHLGTNLVEISWLAIHLVKILLKKQQAQITVSIPSPQSYSVKATKRGDQGPREGSPLA